MSIKKWLIIIFHCLMLTMQSTYAQNSIQPLDSSNISNIIIDDSTFEFLKSQHLYPLASTSDPIVIKKKETYYPTTIRSTAFNTDTNYHTILFYIFCGILLILGVIRYLDDQYFKKTFNAFVNPTNSQRYIKSQMGQSIRLQILNQIVYFIIMGIHSYLVLISLFNKYTNFNGNPYRIIAILTISIFALHGIKILFLKFLSYLFDLNQHTEQYTFNLTLVNNTLAVILIPFSITIALANPIISKIVAIISLLLIVFAILNRYARTRESISNLFLSNKFHFFIYLCTSEILPLIIIAKFLISNN